MTSTRFEFIGTDQIALFENGREKETLTCRDYNTYTKERDIGLIPTSYYRFMRDSPTLSDMTFVDHEWNNDMVPKIGGTDMNKIYFPFQRITIFRMIKSKRCINSCAPGLGKTIQALSSLKYFYNEGVSNDLILCPSYLRANWVEEITKWYPGLIDMVKTVWKAGKKELDIAIDIIFNQPGIKVVSYGMFASICDKWANGPKDKRYFNTVIMDESHFMKSRKSNRYKHIAPVIKKAAQLFLLTGTPAPNRSNELYTQFSVIAPYVFYDYMPFAYRFCDGKFDNFNRFDDRGISNTRELSHMMSKLCLRLRREDHLDDLPDVIRQRVVLTPKTVSKKFLKKKSMFLEALKTVNDSEEIKFKLQAIASEMFRDTAEIKVDPVLEYLDNYTSQDADLEKTILFCKHQVMLQPVTEFLTSKCIDYITVSGQTPMGDRMGLINRFKTDPKCMFAVLTIGSCSTGLNITPVRKMIFMELDWAPSTLDQSECRINRIGGAKHLHYIYLLCEHSLDGMIYNKLDKKTSIIADVVDGGNRYADFTFENDDTTDNTKKQKTVN